MRKALAMAAVLVGLAACTGNGKEWVTVRFEVGVESGDLAVKSEGGVVELLQETRPTGSIELSLEGVDVDFDAVVESGEVVELMAGRYRVTGTYVPDGSEGSVIGFVAQEPFYVVDSEVEVRTNRGSYVVNGAYDCWALVLDTEDTDEYWGDGSTLEGFYGEGRYRVLYVSGSPAEWTLTVLPLDESLYGATDFEMGTNRQLNGKWYCYHPGRGESSGRIGVVLPEWVEGD